MKKYTMTVGEASKILGTSCETIRRWAIQERIDWAVLDSSGSQNNVTVIVPRFMAWLAATDYNLNIEQVANFFERYNADFLNTETP